MGFATDVNKSLSVQVNPISGGRIAWPGSSGTQTSLAMASTSQGNYEFMVLQYDGSGVFRVLDATPATAQAIGMIGAVGISHWSFPAVSAYAATAADNGNAVSSYNSPLSFLAVTLLDWMTCTSNGCRSRCASNRCGLPGQQHPAGS